MHKQSQKMQIDIGQKKKELNQQNSAILQHQKDNYSHGHEQITSRSEVVDEQLDPNMVNQWKSAHQSGSSNTSSESDSDEEYKNLRISMSRSGNLPSRQTANYVGRSARSSEIDYEERTNSRTFVK